MDNLPIRSMRRIEDLLIQHLPRSFVIAARDAIKVADQVANRECLSYRTGIRSSQTGYAKNGRMNEGWHDAALAEGGNPTPLKSNGIVVAQFGIFKVARYNVRHHEWSHKKKLGKKHTEIAKLNTDILAQHVMPDFFKEKAEVSIATAFFVAVIDGVDKAGQPQVTEVQLCAPHPDLQGQLYTKSLTEFIALYDRPARQIDLAHATLKEQIKKQNENDQGHQ